MAFYIMPSKATRRLLWVCIHLKTFFLNADHLQEAPGAMTHVCTSPSGLGGVGRVDAQAGRTCGRAGGQDVDPGCYTHSASDKRGDSPAMAQPNNISRHISPHCHAPACYEIYIYIYIYIYITSAYSRARCAQRACVCVHAYVRACVFVCVCGGT